MRVSAGKISPSPSLSQAVEARPPILIFLIGLISFFSWAHPFECMLLAEARVPLNSSLLVRFLTENGLSDATAPVEEVGQQLGDWLNFRQAIALHGLLGQDAPAPTQRRIALPEAESLRAQVQQVHNALHHSISQGTPVAGQPRLDLPPVPQAPFDPSTAYEPFRRYHIAQQRQMQSQIRLLRAMLRSHVAACSAPLQQLAALDASFENILSEREEALLGRLPKLLEKRFSQALKKHLQQPAAAPDTWLTAWCEQLRAALLAELDTRMQASLGLLKAYNPP